MGKTTRDLLATQLGRLDILIFECETGRRPDDLASLYRERAEVWRQIGRTYDEDSTGAIGSYFSACADERRARGDQ